MKEGWEYKKLKEVGLTQTGTTPSKQIRSFYGGDIPFIRPAELNVDQNGGIQYNSELKLTEEGALKSRVIKANSVLMCCIGSVGKTGFTLYNVTCNQQINTLTPYDNYNPRFVYYALISPIFQQKVIKIANSAKATLPIISKGKWEVLEIPVPPLSEQQTIVAYLDSAFAKIDAMKANAEKALNEAKALFQASLKEMLEPKEGWEEKKLKEVAKYRRGSFPQPYGNKEWYDGEGSMPFVQVAELQEDSFRIVPVTKRRISKMAQPFSVFVPAGTVIVSLQGSIGKVAITDYDSYVDRTVAIFQDYKIQIDKTFFAYQLKIRFEIERLKARGTTIKTITKEEFANFKINCPPFSEQKTIVATLDSLKSKVDRLQANFDKISQECDALKQAILRQVFE